MKVLQIGSFDVSHTTEMELRKALTANVIDVVAVSERDCDWNALAAVAQVQKVDWCLWTTTYSNAPESTYPAQRVFLAQMRDAGIPVIALHLDLFHSLDRERANRPKVAPFFRCDHVFTADGGHDERWREIGVNHHWLPPGVSQFEAVPGTPRDEYVADVTFVGSWQGHYHESSTHRFRLIEFLRDTYGDRAKFWPREGEPAVRGEALRDLYASTRVCVGDSCMRGMEPIRGYLSDRTPETLLRGGFLLHPHTPGVHPDLWESGKHLVTWTAGDWDELRSKIDYYLANPEERAAIAAAGRAHTLARHTYTHRVREVVETIGLAQ